MDEQDKFNESLENMVGDLNNASGATNELVQALMKLNKQAKEEQQAKEAEAKILRSLEERQKAVSDGLSGFGSAVVGTVASMGNISSSVYGADKAFTSVIPTVDAVSKVASKVVESLGLLGSGFSAFGFSFGRASEGMAKAAVTGIEAASGIIKFQLETAQKVADTFVDVAKTGATFGGSIGEFANAAAEVGIPMQTFGKIITSNIESINKLGLGMRGGALAVGDLTEDIAQNENKLLAMYGSFDALGAGVSDYLALQAQLGVDVRNNTKAQISGAKEYLMRQKELADITGKNADALKKEEQERRTHLDYQLKAGRLGVEAQANLQESMAVSGKIFGPAATKYAEEFFATGGKVVTAESIAYAATNQEAALAIENMVSGINQSREAFRQGTGDYLKANAGILEGAAKQNESLAEINRAANNPYLKGMAETSASIIENMTLIRNYTAMAAKLEQDRNKDAGAESDAVAAATRKMMAGQLEIDKQVRSNMSEMTTLVGMLQDLQMRLIKSQGSAIDLFNDLFSGTVKATDALGKFTDKLLGTLGVVTEQRAAPAPASNLQPGQGRGPGLAALTGPPATPVNPEVTLPQTSADVAPNRSPMSQYNKRADGGLAYGPTLTGEDGPEAHIPLKGGNIPMNIDFSSVIQVMREQNMLTQELIGQVRDSKDVQERILNASY